jgi:hypothetical protein
MLDFLGSPPPQFFFRSPAFALEPNIMKQITIFDNLVEKNTFTVHNTLQRIITCIKLQESCYGQLKFGKGALR